VSPVSGWRQAQADARDHRAQRRCPARVRTGFGYAAGGAYASAEAHAGLAYIASGPMASVQLRMADRLVANVRGPGRPCCPGEARAVIRDHAMPAASDYQLTPTTGRRNSASRSRRARPVSRRVFRDIRSGASTASV
jgi:hypothetical protein